MKPEINAQKGERFSTMIPWGRSIFRLFLVRIPQRRIAAFVAVWRQIELALPALRFAKLLDENFRPYLYGKGKLYAQFGSVVGFVDTFCLQCDSAIAKILEGGLWQVEGLH